jgi:hypothetical protein
MFSYKERMKAVKLLIQYDMSYATATRELGYPTRSISLSPCKKLTFKFTKQDRP